MVLAKLSALWPLCVFACGGVVPGTDGGMDATVAQDANDAADESKDAGKDAPLDVNMSCDGSGPIDAGIFDYGVWACCQGKLCRGWCSDAGACVCDKVPGGCAPLYCCPDRAPMGTPQACWDWCGKGG